jgi:predicted DNA binding protein
MRYCELHVRHPAWMEHPMQQFLREGDAIEYEELLAWNLMPDRDVEFALFYVAGDRAAYRERIEAVDSVRRFSLTAVDERSFYSYVCQETRDADVAFREAFADLELVVIPPLVYDHQGDLHVTLVGEAENFRRLLEGLPEEMDADVRSLGEYDRRHATVTGDLTDRQYEAVAAAVELGYYDTPATASLEAVGEALDCAPSTASNLLSKAEAAVMGRVVRGPRG